MIHWSFCALNEIHMCLFWGVGNGSAEWYNYIGCSVWSFVFRFVFVVYFSCLLFMMSVSFSCLVFMLVFVCFYLFSFLLARRFLYFRWFVCFVCSGLVFVGPTRLQIRGRMLIYKRKYQHRGPTALGPSSSDAARKMLL